MLNLNTNSEFCGVLLHPVSIYLFHLHGSLENQQPNNRGSCENQQHGTTGAPTCLADMFGAAQGPLLQRTVALELVWQFP